MVLVAYRDYSNDNYSISNLEEKIKGIDPGDLDFPLRGLDCRSLPP